MQNSVPIFLMCIYSCCYPEKKKNGTPETMSYIVLKMEQWFYSAAMQPNDADGMANSVDPDQTAHFGAV